MPGATTATVLFMVVFLCETFAAADSAANATDQSDASKFRWECNPELEPGPGSRFRNLFEPLGFGLCWRKEHCRAELPESVPIGTRIGRIPLPAVAGLRIQVKNNSPLQVPCKVQDGYLTTVGEINREWTNNYSFFLLFINDKDSERRNSSRSCEEIRVDLRVLDIDDNHHFIECPTDIVVSAHPMNTDGKSWTFRILDDDSELIPVLELFLEGPVARFFRLSAGRPLHIGRRAAIDYDIFVKDPVPPTNFYNLTIIGMEVTSNYTSECRVLLWDPHFLATSLFELMTMTMKFTMTPGFDTRPRFSHCPSTLRTTWSHISAAEELVMIAAEAYLSKPVVQLIDSRLELFAHDEHECRFNWYCTNYLIVNGRRPLNIDALGELVIQLNMTAIFGGRSANECRIVLTAKSGANASSDTGGVSESNTTKTVAPSTSTRASATMVGTSAWSSNLVFAFAVAVSCFAAFAVGCLCGLRRRGRCLVRLITVTWTRDDENFELQPARDDVSTRTGHTSVSYGASA